MQKYLPSKIFIAVAASALFIVGGGYFVFYVAGSKQQVVGEEKSSRQSVAQSGEASLFANKDTDGDGLKDWEEVLWHTDANKADTDGDSTKDNDEILAKRDPTKAAPGDELNGQLSSDDVIATPQSKGGNPPGSPDTLTEQLARDFGEAYMRQKFGKKEVDEQYLSRILFSDLTNILTQPNAQLSKQEEGVYVEKQDLFASNDTSPSATKRYINHVGDILISSSLQEEQNEIQLVLGAVKEERLEDLQKLLAYRDAYQITAKRLKETSVPSHLLNTHQAMINSLWRLGLAAEEMSRFSEDPVGGLTAMNNYMAEAKRSIVPLKTIVAEIKKYHFIFKDDEGGALFNRYLDIAA